MLFLILVPNMHVLTVLDHPNPKSFSAAVARTFINGIQDVGHTAELADLHAEGFDPRWTQADIDADPAVSRIPSDIAAEQARIGRADAVCFVFPLFWWGMPAMTKGWVDRVWSWGWAYDQLADPEFSLQRSRSCLLLVPAGARSDEVKQKGYLAAMKTTWIDGTLGYFGLNPRNLELLYGSTGSLERRTALLAKSYQIGLEFLPE